MIGKPHEDVPIFGFLTMRLRGFVVGCLTACNLLLNHASADFKLPTHEWPKTYECVGREVGVDISNSVQVIDVGWQTFTVKVKENELRIIPPSKNTWFAAHFFDLEINQNVIGSIAAGSSTTIVRMGDLMHSVSMSHLHPNWVASFNGKCRWISND